jgi:hypothetical protein
METELHPTSQEAPELYSAGKDFRVEVFVYAERLTRAVPELSG